MQTVFFKNTGVIVHRTQVPGTKSAQNSNVFLETRLLKIQLDTAATEVLVSYLQVIRAFLANSPGTKQQVTLIFEQVAAHLEQQLNFYGRTTAEYEDIKELIQQLGCLHDWATKRNVLLQDHNYKN